MKFDKSLDNKDIISIGWSDYYRTFILIHSYEEVDKKTGQKRTVLKNTYRIAGEEIENDCEFVEAACRVLNVEFDENKFKNVDENNTLLIDQLKNFKLLNFRLLLKNSKNIDLHCWLDYKENGEVKDICSKKYENTTVEKGILNFIDYTCGKLKEINQNQEMTR